MSFKLPRTIRLDPSDTLVFARAAAPGDWAVSGAFMFAGRGLESLSAKERIAFRGGFLGVASLGWSTLVVVSPARADERDAAVAALARRLRENFGAPDDASARTAAQEEIDFAASLCGHPEGTLLGVHRVMDEGGIREQFRSLQKRAADPARDRLHGHSRAFHFIDSDEEEAVERVDLAALAKKTRGGL